MLNPNFKRKVSRMYKNHCKKKCGYNKLYQQVKSVLEGPTIQIDRWKAFRLPFLSSCFYLVSVFKLLNVSS